jgi:uncharacterized protein YndB with AHSA1/START domain
MTPAVDASIVIAAPPGRVLRAFFDHDALSAWWQVARSVTTPRLMGPYAIEWQPTEFRDELLGRLGGVFRGTVIEFDADRGFIVGDAYWLPPDGDPVGPMALEVEVAADASGKTRVRVQQTGFEESARWRRYYETVAFGWGRALGALKSLLER